MKRNLLCCNFLLFILASLNSIAQDYEWAYTANRPSRTNVIAIREDHTGNFYLATITDSSSVRLLSQVERRDQNQQLIWNKQIDGNVTIADIEINPANHIVVAGYFEGTISIDGNSLTSVVGGSSGFIFEADETGSIQWVHDLNPVTDGFRPVDLFIAPNGGMYMTSELSGGNVLGFCAFHKLDSQGNIILNEFNSNFEDRTFSHILADNAGNVYLSGTCGNGATFDTIPANPSFSYQNFLAKYDSSFKAQWCISKNYVTFDHNNKLVTDGQNLFWLFNDFSSVSADTVKILKTDFNGQVISSIDAPLAISFFPGMDFSMDHSGNSTLLIEAFTSLYVYRYDVAFNIVWADTLPIEMSGFPLHTALMCYDSSFYLSTIYMRDTLDVGSFELLNPNAGTSYPSDIFITKWSNRQATSIQETDHSFADIKVFPNPSSDHATVHLALTRESEMNFIIRNTEGQIIANETVVMPAGISDYTIHTSAISSGIYHLTITTGEKFLTQNFIVNK
jgi:hypothetical protein